MSKLITMIAGACLAINGLFASDFAYVNCKGEIIIETQVQNEYELHHYKAKPVYYVDIPADVVSPPNNGAYSTAAITKDFIWFSGVTGQDLNGNPVPIGPNEITQITQAYDNMQAILNYFQIPVTNVLKLDVDIAAPDEATFLTYRSTTNTVQSQIWTTSGQPPSTIKGVSFLNLGILEVTFTARNTRKVIVVPVLAP